VAVLLSSIPVFLLAVVVLVLVWLGEGQASE
jgi:hypothetical protein